MKPVTFKPRQLNWTTDIDKWTGEISGTSVCFCIEPTGEDKYRLSSNIEGIRKLVLRELEQAKNMAQEQFETYVRSLFVFSMVTNHQDNDPD